MHFMSLYKQTACLQEVGEGSDAAAAPELPGAYEAEDEEPAADDDDPAAAVGVSDCESGLPGCVALDTQPPQESKLAQLQALAAQVLPKLTTDGRIFVELPPELAKACLASPIRVELGGQLLPAACITLQRWKGQMFRLGCTKGGKTSGALVALLEGASFQPCSVCESSQGSGVALLLRAAMDWNGYDARVGAHLQKVSQINSHCDRSLQLQNAHDCVS